MSSSDGYEPSNSSSGNLQSAQSPQEKTDANVFGPEDELFSNAFADREAVTSGEEELFGSRIDDDDTRSELPIAAAKDPAASLENDGSSLPSPKYQHVNGSIHKEHLTKSVWRNRTAAERDVGSGLDRLRAKDLSIHLYNSFQLKRRVKSDREAPAGVLNESAEIRDPSKSWTAWPLPPQYVPREHEIRQWDGQTTLPAPYVARPARAGDELRDLLVAQVLRTARQRFESRQCEDMSENSAVQQFPESWPTAMDSSLAFEDDESVRNAGIQGGEDPRPVVLADDDVAIQILRPTIQHMMTQLDGLLIGLHHARTSYASPKASDTQVSAKKRRRTSSGGRGRRQQRRKIPATDDIMLAPESSSGSDSESSLTEDSRPSFKTKRRASTAVNSRERIARRRWQMGLRDWSDVLGVASMTGVDPGVVGEAASRCAALFEEGMKFKVFHEEGVEDPKTINPSYDKNPEAQVRIEIKQNEDMEMHGGVHVDGFMQPTEGRKSWKYPKKAAREGVRKPIEVEEN